MSDVHASNQIDMFDDPVRVRDGEIPDDLRYDDSQVESSQSPLGMNTSVPAVIRNIRRDQVETRADLIRELTRQVPLDQYNLPQYYYRPDLLDPKQLLSAATRGDSVLVEGMIQAAHLPITWEQGFPTIKGKSIWSQLDFESSEAFSAFVLYLEQPGIRTLQGMVSVDPDLAQEWFYMNYWPSRAKGFDMFKAAHHARLREQRVMGLESDHFLAGEAIFRRLNKVLAGKSDEDLQAMDVDKLITSLERVAKIQRSAVGLAAQGNGKPEDPKATSVEVTMRNVSQEVAQQRQDDDFDITMFDDLETLNKAQELVIRVNK